MAYNKDVPELQAQSWRIAFNDLALRPRRRPAPPLCISIHESSASRYRSLNAYTRYQGFRLALISPLGLLAESKNLPQTEGNRFKGRNWDFCVVSVTLSSYSDFNSSRVPLISAGGPSRNSSASMCDTLKPNPLRSDEFSREWELMEERSPASLSSLYSWVSWNWRSANKLWWNSRWLPFWQHHMYAFIGWLSLFDPKGTKGQTVVLFKGSQLSITACCWGRIGWMDE